MIRLRDIPRSTRKDDQRQRIRQLGRAESHRRHLVRSRIEREDARLALRANRAVAHEKLKVQLLSQFADEKRQVRGLVRDLAREGKLGSDFGTSLKLLREHLRECMSLQAGDLQDCSGSQRPAFANGETERVRPPFVLKCEELPVVDAETGETLELRMQPVAANRSIVVRNASRVQGDDVRVQSNTSLEEEEDEDEMPLDIAFVRLGLRRLGLPADGPDILLRARLSKALSLGRHDSATESKRAGSPAAGADESAKTPRCRSAISQKNTTQHQLGTNMTIKQELMALQQRQHSYLADVLLEEQNSEKKRVVQYNLERQPKARAWLRDKFARDRAAAKRRIDRISNENQLGLAARMAELNVLR